MSQLGRPHRKYCCLLITKSKNTLIRLYIFLYSLPVRGSKRPAKEQKAWVAPPLSDPIARDLGSTPTDSVELSESQRAAVSPQ